MNAFLGGAFKTLDAFSGAFGIPSASGPPPPTGFAASASIEAVILTWDTQADVFFDVYYSISADFGTATELVNGLDVTSYNHGGQPGEKYYYWLRATNGGGNSAFVGPVSGRGYVTLANSASANLTTPSDGPWILSTLFFRSGGNLPAFCQVVFDDAGQIGVSNGDGTWSDDVGGAPDYDPAISGAFTFNNNSGGSVTFWDTEPA